MDIATVRDIVIVILGVLTIILVIGVMVGMFIAWRKVNNLIISINNKLRPVRRWIAYINGLAKGLNESVNMFKKEGG